MLQYVVSDEALPQIEADVVFFGYNKAQGLLFCEPRWECDFSSDEIVRRAAELVHQWAEQAGAGETEVSWIDYRDPALVAERNAGKPHYITK